VEAVPLAANDKLDELYAVQRVLQAEVDRLQQQHDDLREPSERLRRYILNVQIEALEEEATRLSARISDVLERDLQR
jgi:prefoldin subunit 5